ncbi:MAG TPA: amino acid adenylation domain-containing protein [Herpetosiphonaceae bacterium]
MNPLFERMTALTPRQRELLVLRIKQQGVPLAAIPIVPQPRTGEPLPLSFAQERLWFLGQLQPDSPAYNIALAVQMRGPLDLTALRRSLDAIVSRHEILRTTFREQSGHVGQSIADSLALALPLIELDRLPRAEQERQVQQLAAEEFLRPFDLARGPLLRTTLARLDGTSHVLLLTMHHSISDAWSMAIFLQELAALYRSFADGEASGELHGLPIQYADFAAWQRQWLSQDPSGASLLADELAYWKQHLRDAPPFLDLPTDRPRPAAQTFQGASQALTISADLLAGLNALSQQEGATLFMMLLAAWQLVLGRYAGQDDVLIGSPIAGRTRAELEGLIGLFVNTLVFRARLSSAHSFRALLRQVRETALSAYAHQNVPFEQLITMLQPIRDPARTPLVQVMFVLHTTPPPQIDVAGLSLQTLPIERRAAKFDLSLEMIETPHGLSSALEYNSDLFDADTITRLLDYFRHALHTLVAQPDTPIGRLNLLPDAERALILPTGSQSWNATAAAYPIERGLHELFEAQAARTPEAIAAIDGATRLSYAELSQRSNQLARYLRSLGVGGCPQGETLVGVCLPRSAEMLVALLAVLKAGGAYLPLDPAYPSARLQFMLSDACPLALITQQALARLLPTHTASVVCLDADWPEIALQPTTALVSSATVDHPAYVLYTSGSTGQPKGVIGLHRGALNRLHWMWQRFPFAADEMCCIKTSLNFVDSVWELFGPLLHGVPVVLIADDLLIDPDRLVDVLAATHVTRIVLVPSLLRLLLDRCPDLHRRLPALKLWITSGEELPAALSAQFQARLPERRLLNLYGSSEVAADVTCYELPPDEPSRGHSLIGQPIANTQIYLLDSDMQPVPIGAVGEIYVGGVQLARGYLNRPALTAERFVPDPCSATPGARLYKTGDLARYLANGMIEFRGRRDSQLKVRGMRVELGEIEATLSQHPAVREAIVIDQPRSGQTRLVAYVVANKEQGENQELETRNSKLETRNLELRAFLQSRLPDYMVPSAFVVLDDLPLTPNGKLDRRALPDADRDAEQARATSPALVLPETGIQRAIAAVWQDVLKVERVGMYDSFFDLGGHSLLLAELRYKLSAALGREISMLELFKSPTISALSAALSPADEPSEMVVDSQQRAESRSRSAQRQRQRRQHSYLSHTDEGADDE